MRLLDRLIGRTAPQRAASQIQLLETWGNSPVGGSATDYATFANEGYSGNGPVFSVIRLRMAMLAEATDKIGVMDKDTRKVDMAHPALRRLVGVDLRRFARRAEMHASVAGNAYATFVDITDRSLPQRQLRLIRPDKLKLVSTGSKEDPTDIVGYYYSPNGTMDRDTVFLPANLVAHWAPEPHPQKNIGMSWLTPIAEEVDADNRMGRHSNKFFENAATPNLLLKVEHKLSPDAKKALVDALETRHQGWQNAYRPLLLEDGLDATVVGSSFKDMEFTDLAAAGESRIANAAGVPPQIAGFSRGLDASTYTNYVQAFRAWMDTGLRDHWGGWFNSLATILPTPSGTELSYAEKLIPALQQDAKDDAEIRGIDARTVQTYIMAGFDPESAVAAVTSGEPALLVHSGGTPTTLYDETVEPTALPSGAT